VDLKFNYYNFLKEKELKYDIKIDLSGVPLQADANITASDEDELIEVNLNEQVDENVNFIFRTYVEYIDVDGNLQKRLDGEDVIQELSQIQYNSPIGGSLNINGTKYSISPKHILLADNGIPGPISVTSISFISNVTFFETPYSTKRYYLYKVVLPQSHPFDDTYTDNNVFLSHNTSRELTSSKRHYRIQLSNVGSDVSNWNTDLKFWVSSAIPNSNEFFIISPGKYPNILSNSVIQISAVEDAVGIDHKRKCIVDREVFAALGLWNNNSYNIGLNGKPLGLDDGDVRGYISKKDFDSKFNRLRSILSANGVDVIKTEFTEFENENNIDVNKSFIERSDKFNNVIDASNSFISAKSDILSPLNSDDITAFSMSIKSVFKQYFKSADQLEQELIDEITELVDILSSIPGLGILGVNIDEFDYIQRVNVDAVEDIAYNEDGSTSNITADDGTVYLVDEIPTDVDEFEAVFEPGTTIPIDPTQQTTKLYFVTDSDKNKQPLYKYIIDGSATEVRNALLDLRKVLNRIQSAAALASYGTFGLSAGLSAAIAVAIELFKTQFAVIDDTLNEIYWYQHFTNESILEDRSFFYEEQRNIVTDSTSIIAGQQAQRNNFNYDQRLARLLIPVDYGVLRKKKRSKNLFGFSTTTYTTEDLGVRWVEIKFVDTNVFSKYRQNDTPSGLLYNVNIPISSIVPDANNSKIIVLTLSEGLPQNVLDREPVSITVDIQNSNISGYNQLFTGEVINSTEIRCNIPEFIGGSGVGLLKNVILPYLPTQEDDDPAPLRVLYAMPHLPFDSELKDVAFETYGPFDQSQYANRSRGGDLVFNNSGELVEPPVIEGWQIFPNTSKEISELRKGIDIYNKAQYLVKILQYEFGRGRVHIIDTARSARDQDLLQLGGKSSNFLSWHNYRLSIKIKITKDDGYTPIEDGTDDALKLLNISEAFTTNCYKGNFGTPMNVVWCGLLVTNPDLFVWEFLPIGVNHKDALNFRDAAYAQRDPIIANSYVNVTSNNYVIDDGREVPSNVPYIRAGSKGLVNAITINNEKWVHPKYIKNYEIPSNLILRDLQEFLILIQRKMDANGTELSGSKRIQEWKAKNPQSFNQLVLYYSLIGNFSAARGLISGDYIEKFQELVTTLATLDPIGFVRTYLGESGYNDIKIYIDNFPDSSYIKLSDGTLTLPVLEARSTQPEGSGNTFGQKQIDFDHVEFGQYQDGVFIPEGSSEINFITTEVPVIDGYDENNNPVDGDTFVLHKLIADQIIEEFNEINDDFINLNIKFMHDYFLQGSNKNQLDTLENEFGAIQAQDLLTYDQLRDLYKRIEINSRKNESDGTVRGAGANIESQNEEQGDYTDRNKNQSVFEKLVSNSQLSGIRRADISKEKPVVENLKNDVSVEKIVKFLENKNSPDVRDIL